MPEIEITSEQQERLRELQEDLARDVVGKYGHVRARDAVEYLLDRYESDEAAEPPADDETDGHTGTDETVEGATARVVDEEASDDGVAGDGDDGDASDGTVSDDGEATDAADGGDDAMLNEMMSLLDTHDDKWGESSGDERYSVELPDGSSEQVRTKDDVKALLFKHYR